MQTGWTINSRPLFHCGFRRKGRHRKLAAEIQHGLDTGLTINEIKEVLIQLYAYAGFSRSLNALAVLMGVVEQRQQQGITDNAGEDASSFPENWNALEGGTQNQTRLIGKPVTGPLFTFAPAIDQFLKTHLFGDIFQRDTLSWQTGSWPPFRFWLQFPVSPAN
jgi:alkylhydroperoxidase/carboxymuconolactone decarboxylase family protein YurZ